MSRNWRKIPWHLRYRTMARLASEWRKLMITLTHQHCTVEFRGPVRLGPGFALEIPDRGTFIVGPGVDFRRNFRCEISGSGRVEIGAGTVFTADALIQCTTSIVIGKRCGFGQATFIVDGNHRFRDWRRHWLDQGDDFRPITIGDGVAVNTKCTVINSIGERAVIGANSVVTKPIPPYCLAVGVPARVVEYFGPPERRPEGLDI
jgi:acetyltransferase-like isoleucine patch superfamily enzyme